MRFIVPFILCLCLAGCQTMGHISSAPVSSGPREIYATDYSFDAAKGQIKYTLPEPALVRLRIGIKDGGPLVRNLLDWEERQAGAHVEKWDGKDDTGAVIFGQRDDLMLILMCIPKNSKERSSTIRGYRRSPEFNITFPDSLSQNSQGIPIVKDATSVRVTLDPKDQTWLSESKYEVGIYIDNVFLMEDEEGTNPFTYKIDTKMMNNGPHSITVNLAVYDGEIGTKSILINVDNKNA